MKSLILSIILIVISECSSHEAPTMPVETQTPSKSGIELKSNFTTSDFRSAVIGKWKSVFTYESRQNIQNIELTSDGHAKVVIVQGNKSQSYSGPYVISFDRKPNTESVTFATITIFQDKSNPIILSRVNFGLHNGINIKEGIVLRIDKTPYGVLQKTN